MSGGVQGASNGTKTSAQQRPAAALGDAVIATESNHSEKNPHGNSNRFDGGASRGVGSEAGTTKGKNASSFVAADVGGSRSCRTVLLALACSAAASGGGRNGTPTDHINHGGDDETPTEREGRDGCDKDEAIPPAQEATVTERIEGGDPAKSTAESPIKSRVSGFSWAEDSDEDSSDDEDDESCMEYPFARQSLSGSSWFDASPSSPPRSRSSPVKYVHWSIVAEMRLIPALAGPSGDDSDVGEGVNLLLPETRTVFL
mmetsp:Transcript_9170/g.19452  ORF Transcript_9170/g.19452 Transcript_9170/m.19452 type:complete len:258 (-) Transcript_9170:511-1284(-)